MSTTKRNKILIVIIGILLVTNIAIIALFFSRSKTGDRREYKSPMSLFLKNEIKFTDAQMTAYDTLQNTHMVNVKKFFDSLRVQKSNVYKALGSNQFSDSVMNSAVVFASEKQQSMEAMMLNHVKNIRNICTPAQQLVFDTGFYKVMVRGRRESSRNKK